MNELNLLTQPSTAIKIDVQVPLLAKQVLQRISEILDTKEICIAGGFVRGLYMQQVLGLNPQMKDVDIFADISFETFKRNEERLNKEFGEAVRFHTGQFEKEEHPRGLIEFALPQCLKQACAGAETIQLNFGYSHPWANASKYVTKANVGINQIAICLYGNVIASQSFIDDMTNRTMTMNPDRVWSTYDWARTVKSLERMLAERSEFKGWKCVLAPKPFVPVAGLFWKNPSITLPA